MERFGRDSLLMGTVRKGNVFVERVEKGDGAYGETWKRRCQVRCIILLHGRIICSPASYAFMFHHLTANINVTLMYVFEKKFIMIYYIVFSEASQLWQNNFI